MASVASPMPSVKPISMPEVRQILRRGIALNEAMQELAKWDRARHGLTFESLKALPRDDQAAYEQVAERMIARFEARLHDRELEPRDDVRTDQREAAILMERQRARLAAFSHNHDLGSWVGVDGRFDETASCRRCARVACLVVTYDPLLTIRREGSALIEGCLVATSTEDC